MQTTLDDLKVWPATAQDAINRDALEEWQAIQTTEATSYALATVYRDTVTPTLQSSDHPRIIAAAFIANPLDQHPHFLHRRALAAVARLTVSRTSSHRAAEEWTSTAPATPFGPNTTGGSPVPQSATASAWFRYIMSNGYAAVHEPAHALELWDTASQATDPFNERNVMSHLEARKDYYEVLGDEEQFTTMLDLIPKRRGVIFA